MGSERFPLAKKIDGFEQAGFARSIGAIDNIVMGMEIQCDGLDIPEIVKADLP